MRPSSLVCRQPRSKLNKCHNSYPSSKPAPSRPRPSPGAVRRAISPSRVPARFRTEFPSVFVYPVAPPETLGEFLAYLRPHFRRAYFSLTNRDLILGTEALFGGYFGHGTGHCSFPTRRDKHQTHKCEGRSEVSRKKERSRKDMRTRHIRRVLAFWDPPIPRTLGRNSGGSEGCLHTHEPLANLGG